MQVSMIPNGRRQRPDNLIFDMVVPHEYDQAKQRELHDLFVRCIRERDSRYQCVITVETSFINEKEK